MPRYQKSAGFNKINADKIIATQSTLTSITVSDTAVFEGQVSITDTTNSTSSTTGALTVGGGLGIANRLVVGGDIEGGNDLFLDREIRLGTYETVIKTTNGLLGAARCITIGSENSSLNMNNTAARNDIVIGLEAGMAITSGKSNILIGSSSGNTITTQPDNICIGGDADVSTTSITNTISIGRTALSESSNQTTIGNASMAIIRAGADNVCDLGESGRQFKDLYLGGNITLPSTGATASALNFYAEGTHTTDFSGIWAAAQSNSIKWTRVGNMVTLAFPDIRTTANTASSIVIDTVLPTYLRPVVGINMPALTYDNNVGNWGNLVLDSAGSINIWQDEPFVTFGGAGSSGFRQFTCSYIIG